jgi:hypothetical protein
MKPGKLLLLSVVVWTSTKFLVSAADVLIPNVLKHELWYGKVRADVENGKAGTPSFVNEVTDFHMPVSFADSFSERVSGVFIPAVTGDYVFFVSSDDDSDLFLSKDEKPSNKRQIAQETAYSNDSQWISSAGNSSLSQKRSDQYSSDGGTTTPYANGIHLLAGQRYYIEGVHHEGSGGDNFSATYKLRSEPDPADGDSTILTNAVIGVLIPAPTVLAITTQPQNATAYAGTLAEFKVQVNTDSQIPPSYQWRRGGNVIDGATDSSYRLIAGPSDTGATFDCVISIENLPAVPGLVNPITSTAGTLTVQTNGVLFVSGAVKEEFYAGASSRISVEAGAAVVPKAI